MFASCYQLLLKEVKVHRFDPAREGSGASGTGGVATKVRSKWCRVEIAIHQLLGMCASRSDLRAKVRIKEEVAPCVSDSTTEVVIEGQSASPGARVPALLSASLRPLAKPCRRVISEPWLRSQARRQCNAHERCRRDLSRDDTRHPDCRRHGKRGQDLLGVPCCGGRDGVRWYTDGNQSEFL